MKARHIVQFVVLGFMLVFLLAIFIENINLRKTTQVDFEQYRTLVHKAVTRAILADRVPEDEVALALSLNQSAQAMLDAGADLAGGHQQLTKLSGLDTAHILNTMVYHERQIRQVAIRKGLLPSHTLNEASFAEKRPNDVE